MKRLNHSENRHLAKDFLRHIKFFMSRVSFTLGNSRRKTNLSSLVLLSLMSAVSPTSAAATDTGTRLSNTLAGTFGTVTNAMKTDVVWLLEKSGLNSAAIESGAVLDQLAEGVVPVISDLENPYHDNVEQAITLALEKSQMATNIINKLSGEDAQDVLKFIAESALFVDADIGMTLPNGWLRIYRKGNEVSICTTVVGPQESIIISGISNAAQLCNSTDPRMANPSKIGVIFTSIASEFSRISLNLPVGLDSIDDLTEIPPTLEAVTYVTINGQRVQIRLAGADLKSLKVEGKLAVGVKGGINDALKAELNAEATIKYEVDILHATEVIIGVTDTIMNKAGTIGIDDITMSNDPADAAAILQAGLDYLSAIKVEYDLGNNDIYIGETSINVEVSVGVGVGFWDTGVDLASLGNEVSLSVPLLSLKQASDEGLLLNFINAGLSLNDAVMGLNSSIILENATEIELQAYKVTTIEASRSMFDDVIEFCLLLTNDMNLKSEFKIVVAGTSNGNEAVEVFRTSIDIPVGEMADLLRPNVDVIADSITASAYLLLAGGNANAVIPDAKWLELDPNILSGIKFSLLAMPYIGGGPPIALGNLVGIKDTSLSDATSLMIEDSNTMIGILSSVPQSARENSLEPLHTALDNAFATSLKNTLEYSFLLDFINHSTIAHSFGIGINGELGAEGVIKLGAGFKLESEIKTSLFLLMSDSPDYQEEDLTVLGKMSLPISGTLGLGANIGEGVEFTLNANGTLSWDLFELTATHWDGPLPAPASVKVAGFRVLEFDGLVNPDKSFAGKGLLILPMGGLAEAEFSVDANGNVLAGSWTSWRGDEIDLGPLGKSSYIGGELKNDGLHGFVDVSFMGSQISANFILQSTGQLLSSYDGALTVGNQTLATVNLVLGIDGSFSGQSTSSLDIAGFSAATDLSINIDGFAGSGTLSIVGSQLHATDIIITRSGSLSATFNGEIQAGPHTLSSVILRAVNGGLVGTAIMDLPGAPNVEVALSVINSKLMATYTGDFLGGLSSQASMVITSTGISLSASLNTSQLTTAINPTIDYLQGVAQTAEPLLSAAEFERDAAQLAFDLADDAIRAVQSGIDSLQAEYKILIDAVNVSISTAQTAVATAQEVVKGFNNQITALDNWYNGLSLIERKAAWGGYEITRAGYIGLRDAAQLTLTGAKTTLANFKTDLADLEAELDGKIDTLKADLQTAYDSAESDLIDAVNYVNRLILEISILTMSADNIFSVQSMSFKAELSNLLLGNSFAVNTRMTFIGEQGLINLNFNPSDPADSLYQIASALVAGNVQLSNNDTTPPTVVSEMDFAQRALADAKKSTQGAWDKLNYVDNQIVTLQESIENRLFDAAIQLNNSRFEVYRLMQEIETRFVFNLLPGNIQELIRNKDIEGLIAIIDSLSVADLKAKLNEYIGLNNYLLNLQTELASFKDGLQSAYDTALSKQADAQNYLDGLIAMSSSGQSEGILTQLSATDNVDVASITYSSSGAQIIPETTVAGDLASILIEVEGMTSLSFYTTDINGNVSATTTMTTSLDRSSPQISVTPSGINSGVYELVISAQDLLGSGVKYIAVSASGAEYFSERISPTDKITIDLTQEGITILYITVVDEAGNTTTMAHEVIVPRLFTDNGTPINSSDNNSGGGGSLSLLWMLLFTLALSLRGIRPQQV